MKQFINLIFYLIRQLVALPFVIVGMALLVFACLIGGRETGTALWKAFRDTLENVI